MVSDIDISKSTRKRGTLAQNERDKIITPVNYILNLLLVIWILLLVVRDLIVNIEKLWLERI